jgi:ABC-type transport system involved in multi-copper enzyme maturation permease subunit
LDGNPVLWREWHRRKPSKWSRTIWRFYTLASIAFTALGIYIMARPGRMPVDEIALVLVNGMQVTIGLLLISVSAATSLAEERVRGSLDVLLSTSLSTRSIVWGKWWGAFRAIPFLAVLPGLMVAVAVVFMEQRAGWPTLVGGPTLTWSQWSHWLAVPLTVGLILAYGAALTSVGLVLATWVSRLDRAVSLTVSVFVFMTLVWPIAISMLLPEEEVHGLGLACGSPFMGIGFTGAAMASMDRRMSGPTDRWPPQIAWVCFWILAYSSAAALLLMLELSRFNRKLGRTPEEGMRQLPTPAIAAKEPEREAVLASV